MSSSTPSEPSSPSLSLQQLLPTVCVDNAILKHVRTLFYSSTKNHEHLANLSINIVETPNSPDSLVINALLPTTFTQPSLRSSSSSTTVIPLLSKFHAKPPPHRRPTHLTNSILSLFPPSATCQSSPPLQLHLVLPNVRFHLSKQTDLSAYPLKLVQNSIYILLTTGQPSETAGVLLSCMQHSDDNKSIRKNHSRDLIEVLEPTTFDSSGQVAGVWVRSRKSETALLALHALAASWWSRRNKRLSHVPTRSTPQGEWYERRVWLVHFHDSGRITAQSGSISVCDDGGTHFTASVTNASSEAKFEAQNSSRRASTGSVDVQKWRSSWVPSPSQDELRSAEQRSFRRSMEESTSEIVVKVNNQRSKKCKRRIESRKRSKKGQEISDNNSDDNDDVHSEELAYTEDSLLSARMKNIVPLGGILSNEQNPHSVNFSSQVGCSTIVVQRTPSPTRPITINDPSVSVSDSDIETSESGNLRMEELCRKYLHHGYDDELKKEIVESE